MEHRRARRISAQISALVRHRGVPVAYCATRDISLEGAQLNCGGMGFDSRVPLEVDLHLEGPAGTRYVRMPAVVMHCADGRLGVLFTSREPAVLQRLEGLLDEAERMAEGAGGAPEAPQACYSIFL
jgi:hypothetical protein